MSHTGRHKEESKRVRNLLKYLASTSAAIGYTAGDIDNVSSYDPSSARLSTDPILNALAQLACLKTGAERAFISLIDEEYQHVVAEVTSSISIYDSKHHAPDAGLSVGARPLDLLAGVCAGTMPAFTCLQMEPYLETDNIYADRYRYIIRDFQKEDKYKDRPYVAGFPYMRFYGEVPIVSSQGFVLGTLAVIDNKPRDTLSDEHYYVLTELAKAIMRHIEMTMIDQQNLRATKLLKGLNTFVHVDGAPILDIAGTPSNTVPSSPSNRDAEHGEPSKESKGSGPSKTLPYVARTNSTGESSQVTPEAPFDGRPAAALILPQHLAPSSEAPSENSESNRHFQSTADSSLTSGQVLQYDGATSSGPAVKAQAEGLQHPSSPEPGEHRVEDNSDSLQDTITPEDISSSFASASKILLEAMNLDGVVFLDASTSEFASQSTTVTSKPVHDHWRDVSAEEKPAVPHLDNVTTNTARDHTPLPSKEDLDAGPSRLLSHDDQAETIMSGILQQAQVSDLLAISTRDSSQSLQAPRISFPEAVHQDLLQWYPKGHIFDFSQEDDTAFNTDTLSNILHRFDFSGRNKRPKPLSRRKLEVVLRWALPGARTAIFMPVWSPSRHNWLAGCFGWTSEHKRILQQEELSYFSIFSNCLAAHIARIELTVSDRAKSDFISSISHEIRSPLHGILGSAELARQNSDDPDQVQLIQMIEKCGETLLDTMEHILDYAKISTAVVTNNVTDSGHGNNSVKKFSLFDLDEIVEDTVSAVYAGHLHNGQHSDPHSTRRGSYGSLLQRGQRLVSTSHLPASVSIVIDVQSRPSWQVKSSVAAWRRIVSNVFGNALKYTETGLIEVILEIQDADTNTQGSDSNAVASLTVRDTGRGISKHFLQNNLFTPFIQEDSLSVGTGLGLSIINRIVQDLSGQISVQSEVGLGTEVKVSLPLKLISRTAPVPEHPSRGSIRFVGLEAPGDLAERTTGVLPVAARTAIATRLSVQRAAEHRCDLTIASDADVADVIAISQSHLQRFVIADDDGVMAVNIPDGSSLLILPPVDESAAPNIPLSPARLKHVDLPIGPRQISAAINKLLASDRTGSLLISEQSNAEPPLDRETKRARKSSIPQIAPRARILIADDNDINIKMLSAQARRLKCEFETASNGQEALDKFKAAATAFDYILMDLSMPIMDGFASAREIRAWEHENGRTATPIIALTGLSSASAQQYALTSGIDLFMTKPVPMSKIEALVTGGVDAVKDMQ